MIELRGYQTALCNAIYSEWNGGALNVIARAPTGSGKTVVFSHIVREHRGAACLIAHRQELVAQISLALAIEGVPHSIIGQRHVIKFIIQQQQQQTGASFYDPNAPIAVAGVDSLIKRDNLSNWAGQVSLWIQDEAHHLLAGNKWGQAVAMFPNARGLGVTATPCRADGKGLGRHADGVFDSLVHGPEMRELITAGHLSDYEIFIPPNDLDISSVAIGSTGDYNQTQLRRAVQRSHIVGDVVEQYLRLASGKLGLTFTTDVEGAAACADRFNAAGIPAAVISAKTPPRERQQLLTRYLNRELLQIVNVDIFGEGFDFPALEVVSFARPTASYPLYCQQFGRGGRPFKGKNHTIIIDHVGNVLRHNGPPDIVRPWSLDRRETARRGVHDPDLIPQKVCSECTRPYEAVLDACPYCLTPYQPARRDGPQFVAGDLVQLDPALLAEMRGEIARIDESVDAITDRMSYAGAPDIAIASAAKNHRRRAKAQDSLRRLMSVYGGLQRSRGRSNSEAMRRFYFRYNVDVLTAQALGRPEAENLALRMLDDFGQGRA